jgi:DNA-binding transcriptional ArsR family regulator
MAADDITAAPHEPAGEPYDEVFDLLAHPHRRTVIHQLESEATVTVDELAVRIAERYESTSVSDARISLVHNHLPRLAEADVVRYDHSAQRCELDDDATVHTVLAAVKRLI